MQKVRRVLIGTKKRAIISSSVVVVLVASTVALAAWLAASGTGNSQGMVGTAQAVTLTVTADPDIGTNTGSPVIPGAPGALGFLVSSPPGTQALTITGVTQAGPATVTGGTCADSAADFNTHAAFALDQFEGMPIPASASNVSIAKPSVVTLDSSTPPCLSGATFQVPITVVAQ